MSQTDSFIEEVTEEVRRDKFFAFLKKYGWIAILAVLVLVGGAAWNEYSKAQARAQAEATGDAIVAALALEDPVARAQALAGVSATTSARVIPAMLQAGELHAVGDIKGALAALAPFTTDAMLDPVYRDLAVLKSAMIGAGVIEPEARMAKLATIASPGAPYRLLAEEQIAATQVEMGEIEVAIAGFRAISADSEASNGLRRRAMQMIVALGADPEAE